MTTYVSMLRGINVSGQKKVNMQDLKLLYEELNLQNVRTYIQSGNVVFEAEEKDINDVSNIIEEKLFKKYNFEVPVIVKTAADMEAIIQGNTFLQRENIDQDKLHVTFLRHMPSSGNVEKLSASNYDQDEFIICANVIYLFCPNGYGRTKLTNSFFENKLKTIATTRNWRTVNELLKIARQV